MLSRKASASEQVLGRNVKTAREALSFLVEDLDLEVHVCYTVNSFHSFQEALDVCSVHPNILDVEIEINKVVPVFCKFTSEPYHKAWYPGHSVPLVISYIGIRRLAYVPSVCDN